MRGGKRKRSEFEASAHVEFPFTPICTNCADLRSAYGDLRRGKEKGKKIVLLTKEQANSAPPRAAGHLPLCPLYLSDATATHLGPTWRDSKGGREGEEKKEKKKKTLPPKKEEENGRAHRASAHSSLLTLSTPPERRFSMSAVEGRRGKEKKKACRGKKKKAEARASITRLPFLICPVHFGAQR